MELEKLIKKITMEVLNQLKAEEKATILQQKKILVWTESWEMKEQLSAKLKLPIEQLQDRIQFRGLKEIESYDAIILPEVSVGEMVHIALGIQQGETETLVSKALLLGKKVCMLRDGLDYRESEVTANPAYYKMLQGYETQLSHFGISLVDWEELELSGEAGQPDVSQEKSRAYCVSGRLVTESLLEELFLKGYQEIGVAKNAVITPLAADYIKRKQLKITRGLEESEKGSSL